jgi:hypothetical protein
MMMESIRIERKDIYTIEVNDKGETIEFDLVDIELPFKAERALSEVNRIYRELQAKLVIIEKREDHKTKDGIITANERDRLEAHRTAFKEMRVAMDAFLGEGACQKIFGDRNYVDMYDDLFDALEPHFEKMKLNTDGITERIKAKYSKKADGVLR